MILPGAGLSEAGVVRLATTADSFQVTIRPMRSHRWLSVLRPDSLRRFIAGVAALTLLGCAVRLISEYDDVTDREVMQLQRSVDGYLLSLSRSPTPPGCTHARRAGFYDSTLVALNSLTLRNRARSKNQLTVQQLELLDSSLVTFERLHQLKGDNACLSAAEILPARASFNTSFTAIVTLELAKKR